MRIGSGSLLLEIDVLLPITTLSWAGSCGGDRSADHLDSMSRGPDEYMEHTRPERGFG
jgi:hypothetical protein